MGFSADVQEPLATSFSADVQTPLVAGVTPSATAAEAAATQLGVNMPGKDTCFKTNAPHKILKATEGRYFAVQFDTSTFFFYIGLALLFVGLSAALHVKVSCRSGSPLTWSIVTSVTAAFLVFGWFMHAAFITHVVLHKDHLALHYMMRKVVMPYNRITRVALSENWGRLAVVKTCPTASNCNVTLASCDDGIYEFSLKDRASFMQAMAPLVHVDAGELLFLTLEYPV